jgi:hypothetical protein
MIRDGYRETFANAVSEAMQIRHRNGMEGFIPEYISSVSDVVYAPEHAAMRRAATDKLRQVMRDNGADYNVINRYLKGQQQDSWGNESLAMKYFLLKQRRSNADFDEIYFVGGKTLDDLRSIFVQELARNNIGSNLYAKSVAFSKAFTAIALNKVRIDGRIDHEDNICTIQRGMKRADLIRFYPEYKDIGEGGIFMRKMKHGIADSVALGAPAHAYTNPQECDVIEIRIPFSRVLAAYFVSPELSFDRPPYGIPITAKGGNNKRHKGSEHELVCDMSNLPIKIRKMCSSQ